MSWSVADAAQIRRLDAHTIGALGVPPLVLMETAARAVVREMLRRFPEELRRGTCVVAGRGNNGGDGYAVARLLHLGGFPVTVTALPGEPSPDCQRMRAAAEGVGVPVGEVLPPAAAIWVDAVFGTGLDRPVTGRAAELIAAMRDSGAPVVAVDMPSGIGDRGQVMGVAVPAALTLTFDRPRIGQLLEPGADYCGALVVADIGLRGEVDAAATCLDGADIARLLPERRLSGHKGENGHLGVIAGSPEKAGAAVLVCAAALRAGCGLVTLLARPETLPRVAALPPEVMVRVVGGFGPERWDGFDALAVGPGFGLGQPERAALRRAWFEAPIPAIFDADGLSALAEDPRPSPHPRAITPHWGEALRLVPGLPPHARLEMAAALSAIAPALLKGRHTLVAAAGERPVFNRTGTLWLATAGSGDVLTGLVGALLARRVPPRSALIAGAFVHGYAAELLEPGPILAGEVAAALPRALSRLRERAPVFEVLPLLSS